MRKLSFSLLTLLLSVLTGATLLAQNKAYDLALRTIGGDVKLQSGLNKSASYTGEYLVYENDQKSFAIVSADGEHLIGYGKDASASEDMPPALLEFLGDYRQSSREVNLNKAAVTPIETLISTRWNQSWPYNQLMPNDKSGKPCATGCVATAMAQVLNYHGYPNKTVAQIPGYTSKSLSRSLSAISSGTSISWTKLSNTYPKEEEQNSSDQASYDAVAQLMLYCGVSVKMDYGPSSGAYGFDVPLAFINYFGYQDLRYEFRDAFSNDEWFDLIYSELKASRPLLYCGSSPGGGHCFIFDGMDSKGLVHVNWGWGGQLDGYFDINVLHPNDAGQIGAGSNGGYTRQAQVLCNMKKPSGSVQNHATIWSPWKPIFWGEDDGVSFVEKQTDGKYKFKLKVYFYREYYNRDQAYVALGSKQSDSSYKTYGEDLVKENGSGLYGCQYDITVEESEFDKDGIFTLYMLEKQTQSSSFQLTGNSERNKIQIKLENGRVFPYIDPASRTVVQVPAVDNTVYVYNGEKQVYKIEQNELYNVEGNVQTDAGEYEVKVCLTDYTTMVWSDGNTLDKTYKFVIKKAVPNVVAPGEIFLAVKGQRAKNVELPQGFIWDQPEYLFSEIGYHNLKCTFVPDDEKNYERKEHLPVRVYVVNELSTELQVAEEQATWGVPYGGNLLLVCEMQDKAYQAFSMVVNNKSYSGAMNADGLAEFQLPSDMAPGVYMADVSAKLVSGRIINTSLKFKVNYPSSYILTLWNDVLAVNNSGDKFSTFQWYKDKKLLEGQRRQYLPLKASDEGVYTCKVYNSDGVELFITPFEYKYQSAFNLSVSPNPASAGQNITVKVDGLSEKDLDNAKLYVHDFNGKVVKMIFEVEQENQFSLESGKYVVTVVVNNQKAGACVIMVK